MAKREEMRERRRQEHLRNRILIILVVVAGAVVITFGFIWPSLQNTQLSAQPTRDAAAAASLPVLQQTQTAVGVASLPVTPITPRTFNTTVDGAHLGNPDAPVKIDVWEDFQCPACKSYTEQTEAAVIIDYVETGKVYYTFHFYPFIDRGAPGGESQQSANAAMCALEQGRFWDYHDMLFANWGGENQGAFANPRLVAFAESLGLDMTAFNVCFTADRYANQIQQDVVLGQGYGVSGTPSVFVNGTIVTPGFIPSYDDVAQAVEAALSAGQ
jgi:protein-disulfide isomerase